MYSKVFRAKEILGNRVEYPTGHTHTLIMVPNPCKVKNHMTQRSV